ncbi:lamin tail domain-containing protein [Longimicrobium sp.]|uniref:lamin tail domain-containing protein n=1 Tax=Longimicrobium sp. TaxID=2029185 RepID=UPI002E349FC8|nr:lamin tail domain-containing protein [Longimicrobium sp.]HEX6041944.1 lamin tail domain-containing protein [Longimicrobium sp.]
MRVHIAPKTARRLVPAFMLMGALAACSDQQPLGGSAEAAAPQPVRVLQAYDCAGSLDGQVSCRPAGARTGAASPIIIGGQNTYVKLTSSNVSYDSISEIFQFDVTVQNLLNEGLGTPDGVTTDPQGIRVFFHSGPTVTSGTGVASVYNADGYDTFTASSQPYFTYAEILDKNEVSAAKTWQLLIPRTAATFAFQLYVESDVQYLLVINEVLTNPGGTTSDVNGEWFEVYNGGTFAVNLQGLVIADSAASGRRPYHVISSSVSVPSGGYAVLGAVADTVVNGGADVDYAYGSALALANSMDALKISRVYGTDTLTLDRVSYLSAAISAQNGISRELKNPALDNANMDGSNWADASAMAVYGAAGRGTPRAQNSAYVP